MVWHHLPLVRRMPAGRPRRRENSPPPRRLHGRSAVLVLLLCGPAAVSSVRAQDWPQWGGPTRDFKVTATGLADRWGEEGPRKIWSRELGEGYSTIIVKGDRLFTMYRKGERDVIVSLDAATGQTAWEHAYDAPTYDEQRLDFGKGPNASPLIVGDRLITVGFTAKMHCVSLADGKPLWSHDLVKAFAGKVQEFGYSASPIAYKGNVIALVGGTRHGVMALNPKDGSTVWASEPHDISYASPIVINVDGQDQIVFLSSTEVIGLSAADGETLWRHPCVNQYKNNATDPLWGRDNLLWVSTQLDGGTRVIKLAQQGGKTEVKEVWSDKAIKIFHWNAVRVDEHVYASIGSNTTTLAGIEAATGKIAWRRRGFHKALCVYAGGNRLIFLDENGTLALATVSPEGIEIASQVTLTEKVSWTVPTLVGRTLYVRDNKQIMALDLG